MVKRAKDSAFKAEKSKVKVQLGEDSVPKDQWRHFHKITPLTRAGTLWAFLLIILYNLLSDVLQGGAFRDLLHFFSFQNKELSSWLRIALISLGLLILVTILVVVFAFLTWQKETYALVESGIHFRRGIFMKTHIHMRWDRVQSVEIQQKLFGRIFGFGTVKIESAGNDEDLELGLLRMRDAASLRHEVLAVIDRVRSGYSPFPFAQAESACAESAWADYEALNNKDTHSVLGIEGVGAPVPDRQALKENDAPNMLHAQRLGLAMADESMVLDVDDLERDQLIYQLDTKRMVLARICSVHFISMLAVFILIFSGSILMLVFSEEPSTESIPFLGSILVVAGAIWSFIKSIFADCGTRLYISKNGLRKRAGLTKLTTSTYPPQRIHAISIRRPLLWRKFDWWELRVSRAGFAGSSDTESLTRPFVPVATREELLHILWALIPGFGTDNDAALLDEAFDGRGESEWFIGAPRAARYLNPIAWRAHGVALTERAFIVRSGRWRRKVYFAIQDHTQSLELSEGPIQRRLGLANVQAHLVPGVPISVGVKNFSRSIAQSVFYQENELAREARSVGISETLSEWKVRMGLSSAEECNGE